MFGIVIPVGTFYGTQWQLWIATGGLVALILIPWSLLDLFRIQREQWQDTTIEEATT
jgi:cytochrome c biogenesis protein CcdA